MGLFNDWKELANKERLQSEYDSFWQTYLEKEKENYEYLLENHDSVVTGKVSEVAEKFDMDNVTLAGFLDGINTSLVEMIDLDEINEDSELNLEIDYEKLYYNMLDAKANWLYSLPQWDDVLSSEKRDEITKQFKAEHTAVRTKVGRNDPCPCGSGKKYKKCCG